MSASSTVQQLFLLLSLLGRQYVLFAFLVSSLILTVLRFPKAIR